jgi:hypothetical protein
MVGAAPLIKERKNKLFDHLTEIIKEPLTDETVVLDTDISPHTQRVSINLAVEDNLGQISQCQLSLGTTIRLRDVLTKFINSIHDYEG